MFRKVSEAHCPIGKRRPTSRRGVELHSYSYQDGTWTVWSRPRAKVMSLLGMWQIQHRKGTYDIHRCVYRICMLLVCYTRKCDSMRVSRSREQLAFPVFLFSRFQVMEETSTSSGPADEESETFIRVRNWAFGAGTGVGVDCACGTTAIWDGLEALDRRQVRLAAWRAADESNGRFVYAFWTSI